MVQLLSNNALISTDTTTRDTQKHSQIHQEIHTFEFSNCLTTLFGECLNNTFSCIYPMLNETAPRLTMK